MFLLYFFTHLIKLCTALYFVLCYYYNKKFVSLAVTCGYLRGSGSEWEKQKGERCLEYSKSIDVVYWTLNANIQHTA